MKTIIISIVLLLFSINIALAQNQLLDSIKNTSSKENIMETISYFSDVYGPRFLGTPSYYNALKYAKNKLEENGIYTRLETFDIGYRGWDISSFNVELSSP